MYELKQHKSWFVEEHSQYVGRRKQAKMQWLQDPDQSNINNLNNARREVCRHFRNTKREYLTAKINELETTARRRKSVAPRKQS